MRVPFFLGNTIQRDHVSAPISTETGSLTGLMSLDDMMLLYWRVKKWHITGTLYADFSVQEIGGFENANSASLALDITLQRQHIVPSHGLQDVTNERLLLQNTTYTPPIHLSDVFGFSNINWTNTDSNLQPPGARKPEWNATQKKLKLPVDDTTDNKTITRFTQGLTVPPAPGGSVSLFALFRSFWSKGGSDPVCGDLVTALPSQSVTDHLYSHANLSATVAVIHYIHVTVTSPVTFTPLKYYPFTNQLGQPVFDEDSGAQINDPFA